MGCIFLAEETSWTEAGKNGVAGENKEPLLWAVEDMGSKGRACTQISDDLVRHSKEFEFCFIGSEEKTPHKIFNSVNNMFKFEF